MIKFLFSINLFLFVLTLLRVCLLFLFTLSLVVWFNKIHKFIKFFLDNLSILWAAGSLFLLILLNLELTLTSRWNFHTIFVACPLKSITALLLSFTLRLLGFIIMSGGCLLSELLVDFLFEIVQEEVDSLYRFFVVLIWSLMFVGA